MNYTRKNPTDTTVTLAISLDAADLATTKPRTLTRLAQKVKVPGFRPGKVPAAVAEKHLDSNMLSMELADDAINHYIIAVFETEKLQPLDRPKIELTKYVPGELLEFTAEAEIMPAITLGDYKKLNVKKQLLTVEDVAVTEVIDRMRHGMAKKQSVERAAKETDEVTIDFAGTKDGQPVPGATGKDYPLVLGSHSFIPGFEEGLIGKKAGDTFDLPLSFPKDYHHQPLAGAEVLFVVTVKSIKEVVLPELTDAFAASCGPFKTVAELQADVKRELTDQKEREALDKLKDELIEQLIKKSSIPTPAILVADQMTSLERDFTQNLLYRGQTLSQYLDEQKLTESDWREKELRPQAIRRVEVGLALAELSKREEISLAEGELEQRMTAMLQQYGNDQKIREQLKTPEVKRDIGNRLITEKTIDRLVGLNSK